MQCIIPERYLCPQAKIAVLVIITLVLAALSVYCLSNNTQVLFTHLYYVPIILAAFWYGKKGVWYSLGMGVFYLWAVLTFSSVDTHVILAAIGRCLFFVGVSIVIAILSIVITRQQEEVVRSEAQFHSVWDHIQAGIILVDAETRTIMAANPEAQRITGYSEEEMKGQRCHRFVCPAEEGNCPVCDKGMTIDRSERIVLAKDGQAIHVLKTVTDLDLRGRRCLVETFIDIATGR